MFIALAISLMFELTAGFELITAEDAAVRASQYAKDLFPTLVVKPSDFHFEHNVWGDTWVCDNGQSPVGKDEHGTEMMVPFQMKLDQKSGALLLWSDPTRLMTPGSNNPPRAQWKVKTEAEAWEAGRKWLRFAGLRHNNLRPVPFGSDKLDFQTGLRENSSGFYHLVFAERLHGVRGAINQVRVDIAPGTGTLVNIVASIGFTFQEPGHRISALQAARKFKEAFDATKVLAKGDAYYDGKLDWPGDPAVAWSIRMVLTPDFKEPAFRNGRQVKRDGSLKSNRMRLAYEFGVGACSAKVDAENGAVLELGLSK